MNTHFLSHLLVKWSSVYLYLGKVHAFYQTLSAFPRRAPYFNNPIGVTPTKLFPPIQGLIGDDPG